MNAVTTSGATANIGGFQLTAGQTLHMLELLQNEREKQRLSQKQMQKQQQITNLLSGTNASPLQAVSVSSSSSSAAAAVSASDAAAVAVINPNSHRSAPASLEPSTKVNSDIGYSRRNSTAGAVPAISQLLQPSKLIDDDAVMRPPAIMQVF